MEIQIAASFCSGCCWYFLKGFANKFKNFFVRTPYSVRQLKITIITKKAVRRFQLMLIPCFQRSFLVVTVKNTRLANLHISLQRVFEENSRSRWTQISVQCWDTYILCLRGEYAYVEEFFLIWRLSRIRGLYVITDRQFDVVFVLLESYRYYKDFRTAPLVHVVSLTCIAHVWSCIIASLDRKVHAFFSSSPNSIFHFHCMGTSFAENCIKRRRQRISFTSAHDC